jgi:hypothetical protein
MAARLELVVNRDMWKGVAFPISRGLLSRRDSANKEKSDRRSLVCASCSTGAQQPGSIMLIHSLNILR